MQDSKKSIRAWALYDWANSAYVTVVATAMFPLFYSSYWASNLDSTRATAIVGFANSIASLIVAIGAPILGAIADRGSYKKRMLVAFASIGISLSVALAFASQGQWLIAAVLYVISMIGFNGANIFYDALLPSVASEEKIDYVSSLGFAVGYVGGGLVLAGSIVVLQMPHLLGLNSKVGAMKLIFCFVAAWWGIFSIPLLKYVKEIKNETRISVGEAIKSGFVQVGHTFKDIKRYKVAGLFLLAYWFYIDGVDTIIKMAIAYGNALAAQGLMEITQADLIIILLLVQFIAFPCALLYPKLGKLVGIKRAILVAIIGYAGLVVFGAFSTQTWHFYALACGVGMFQGGIQALSRSFYTRLIPHEKAGEFFGFFNLLGKFAAVIGPTLFGFVGLATGSPRMAMLSIVLLFVVGGAVLLLVDEEKGRQMRDAERS